MSTKSLLYVVLILSGLGAVVAWFNPFFWIVPLVLLGGMVSTGWFWFPILMKGEADIRHWWATVPENSALGHLVAGALDYMWLNLTEDGYQRILLAARGYNPFVVPEAPKDADGKSTVSYRDLKRWLRPCYRLVNPHFPFVWVGRWQNGLNSIGRWYMTEALRDAAPKRNAADEGGDEKHSIPLKQQIISFGLPLTADERKALLEKVDDARKSGQRLTLDSVRKLMALLLSETTDGFGIPVAAQVTCWIVGPWEFLALTVMLGDVMWTKLNAAVLVALSRIRALGFAEADESDYQTQLLNQVVTYLREALGLDKPRRPLGDYLAPDAIDDKSFVAEMARYGVAVEVVEVADIVIPDELKKLLNQPAQEEAKKRAELVAAGRRLAVAEIDAQTEEKIGDGIARREKKVAGGHRALLEVWAPDGKTISPDVSQNRLGEIRAERWTEGVKAARSSVVGGPGQSLDGLQAIAGGLGNLVLGGSKSSETKEKGQRKDVPNTAEPPAAPVATGDAE